MEELLASPLSFIDSLSEGTVRGCRHNGIMTEDLIK